MTAIKSAGPEIYGDSFRPLTDEADGREGLRLVGSKTKAKKETEWDSVPFLCTSLYGKFSHKMFATK